MTKQMRHWCITFWKKPEKKNFIEDVRYEIFGEEICPTTGTLHWQSYVEFNKPTSMARVKKIYEDKKIWCKLRKGTRDQAREYCMKDKKFTEIGRWIKGQGHRTDLDGFIDELKEGRKLSEVAMENPGLYCRYRGGLKDIAGFVNEQNSKEFRKLDVEVLWGKAGSGKTRTAVESTDDYYILNQDDNSLYWDGYEGQKTLIIDDFYGWIKYGQLLKILDGYQLRLPVKGSYTYAKWEKVYITSNKPPEEWYGMGLSEALERRLHKINEVVHG